MAMYFGQKLLNIKDVWDQINPNAIRSIQVTIDIYKKLIYVLIPVQGSADGNVLSSGRLL
jgi:hypothetical protein